MRSWWTWELAATLGTMSLGGLLGLSLIPAGPAWDGLFYTVAAVTIAFGVVGLVIGIRLLRRGNDHA